MTSHLDAALTGAALSGRERRVVEFLVARLREELGEDLRAVWLYGSRAHGEADPSEADPDRRSDIDLMIVVDPSRDAGQVSWDIDPLVEEAAVAEGDQARERLEVIGTLALIAAPGISARSHSSRRLESLPGALRGHRRFQ